VKNDAIYLRKSNLTGKNGPVIQTTVLANYAAYYFAKLIFFLATPLAAATAADGVFGRPPGD
jgi:hypothetical protein